MDPFVVFDYREACAFFAASKERSAKLLILQSRFVCRRSDVVNYRIAVNGIVTVHYVDVKTATTPVILLEYNNLNEDDALLYRVFDGNVPRALHCDYELEQGVYASSRTCTDFAQPLD